MRNSRLFWKLLLIYGGMNLSLAIVLVAAVNSFQKDELDRQVNQRLRGIAGTLRDQVQEIGNKLNSSESAVALTQLQRLADRVSERTGTRISIMDSNGDLLADSSQDPLVMLGHANREELVEAGRTGLGTAKRISPTLQIGMQYLAVAVPLNIDDRVFVRVAVESDSVQRRSIAFTRRLWLLALSFWVLAAVMIYAIVNRMIHPISLLTEQTHAIGMGTNPDFLPVQNDDEIGLLTKSFNQMQLNLDDRFRQLRMNSNQMSTVLGSMDEGIIAVDVDQRIVLANPASRSLLNFSTDEGIGRPLLEAVRNRALYDVVKECLETGAPVQDQFESKQEFRRELSVRATCLPGEPANGVVMVLHDITELSRLENLRQEFVANVSHELKTPLASIKAYAETLRLGAMDDPDNNLRFIHCIEEQAERLHQLIMDMLQIARVESGEEAFEIAVIAVQAVVDSCASRHRENAHRKDISLVIEPPGQAMAVIADEDGLDTILDNLISNAIKYTSEGGRVTVRWRDAGDLIEIEVQDTGIGIPEEQQNRVFERFYRADKARSRMLGGTGLGLSIVKHLAQSFNGSVTLTSRVGEGTTFRVRLPKPKTPPTS